jgi:hypothetical protein
MRERRIKEMNNTPFRKEGGATPFRSDFLKFEYDVKSVMDNGVFSGYASTFDEVPDSHGHIIARGAFSKSLEGGGRNKSGVLMLRGHNPDQIPGVWTTLQEDSRGLYNEGMLFAGPQGTPLGNETHVLMKHRAIQHESIGFDLPREKSGAVKFSAYEKDDKNGYTILKEIELWEVSLISFPANVNARVTAVKEFLRQASTEREFESALRDLGLSKSDAQYLVSLIRPTLRDATGLQRNEEKGGGCVDQILNALKTVNQKL